MSSIQIISKNRITFKRIESRHCVGYNIYLIDNGLELFVCTLENPKTPTRSLKKIQLDYNEDTYWKIEDKVIANSSADINVYVNGIKLNPIQYTFRPSINILNIHLDIKEDDDMYVEYYSDEIEYIHNASLNCKYRVEPIFKDNYSVGKHSLLNYY